VLPEGFVVRRAGRIPLAAKPRTASEKAAVNFETSVAKYVRKNHVQTDPSWKRTWRKAHIVAPSPDASAPHTDDRFDGTAAGSNEGATRAFFKFPRTIHLMDMGGTGVTRDDLVMDPADAARFMASRRIVVEEKIDGANLGIRLSDDMSLEFWNRSHRVCSTLSSLWKGLESWERRHGHELHDLLLSPMLHATVAADDGPSGLGMQPDPSRFVLYGEWMAYTHSVRYDLLPDVFLAFDIFDSEACRFLARDRVKAALKAHTTIPMVPKVASFDHGMPGGEPEIRSLLERPSRFRSDGGAVEGLYFRVEGNADCTQDASASASMPPLWLARRAKVVRSDFIQHITESAHWTQQIPQKNGVRGDLLFTYDEDDGSSAT